MSPSKSNQPVQEVLGSEPVRPANSLNVSESRPLTLNGANILRLLRDGSAKDLTTLCSYFGIEPAGYERAYVQMKVNALTQAGLVVTGADGSLKVAENWGA